MTRFWISYQERVFLWLAAESVLFLELKLKLACSRRGSAEPNMREWLGLKWVSAMMQSKSSDLIFPQLELCGTRRCKLHLVSWFWQFWITKVWLHKCIEHSAFRLFLASSVLVPTTCWLSEKETLGSSMHARIIEDTLSELNTSLAFTDKLCTNNYGKG